MANHTVHKTVTQTAGADLTGKEQRIMKYSTGGKVAVATSATADKFAGVLAVGNTSNEVVSVWDAQESGRVPVIAGAAVSAGAFITTDGEGRAVATTTAGNNALGVALTAAAAAGEVIEVALNRFVVPS